MKPVNMVYDFCLKKVPTEVNFHFKAMLRNSPNLSPRVTFWSRNGRIAIRINMTTTIPRLVPMTRNYGWLPSRKIVSKHHFLDVLRIFTKDFRYL